MTNERFEQVFEETVGKCRAILISKNKEYARGGDKLSNFKKAAALQGITAESALKGMMVKHLVSVCDYITDLEVESLHTLEAWDEKVLDSLNYLFLLRGLLEERHGQH